MEWKKERPTEPGWYWIYVKTEWPGDLEIWCVKVCIMKERLSLDFPISGYDCEDDVTPGGVLYWMGPVKEPELPNEVK